MSSELVIRTVMSQFVENKGVVKLYDCTDLKNVFAGILLVANDESDGDSLILSTLLSLITYDEALDDYRTVRVCVQDFISMGEAVDYWEALEIVAHKLMNYDQRNWINSPEDAFCMAYIVLSARKSIKYLTVNLITHHKCLVTTPVTHRYIIEKFSAIVNVFEAMLLKLLRMYLPCQLIDASHRIKCQSVYPALLTCLRNSTIRKMEIAELVRATYCERFRKKLDAVSSVGTLVLNAPDLNSCSLCHRVFLCIGAAELPFVVVSGCSHLFCLSCILEYFPGKADTICTINDCIKWNSFWITRNTAEEYIYLSRTVEQLRSFSS